MNGLHPVDLLALHAIETADRRTGDHERVALGVRRVHRLERWARRADRISDWLSRTAQVRLARLQ